MKYFSEILNKNFDTEKELVKAENEFKVAEAKKAEAKTLVKKESDEVNKAFIARNEARRAYNEKALEAAKTFNQKLKDLEAEYEASIKEAKEAKREAENDFSAKLAAFSAKHPEGYRLTLKDGDSEVTYTNEVTSACSLSVFDAFDRMIDAVTGITNFRNW